MKYLKNTTKIWIALLALLSFLCAAVIPVYAASETDGAVVSAQQQMVRDAITDISEVLLLQTAHPKPGSIGGEWLMLGLARSDIAMDNGYAAQYYDSLESLVKAKKGVLHSRKNTEYSRVVLALTALKKDPTNVAGYNLLTPLGDYKKTVQQGINGAVFALLALDSGNYAMPIHPNATIKATREHYIDYILEKELSGGGWTLSGSTADVDVTAMVLQALSPYQEIDKVKAAIDRGVQILSDLQNTQGGFSSYGLSGCESTAQVIVALTALGIDLEDSRFVKNNNSTLDHLLTYYQKGKGFTHTIDGKIDAMATEQAFYALVAVQRAAAGKNHLYDMTEEVDKESASNANSQPNQLTGVQKVVAEQWLFQQSNIMKANTIIVH